MRGKKILPNKNKLKEMRLKRRLTQYGLAKKVKRSPWWICRVERGYTKTSEGEKAKIAKALGARVKQIFS